MNKKFQNHLNKIFCAKEDYSLGPEDEWVDLKTPSQPYSENLFTEIKGNLHLLEIDKQYLLLPDTQGKYYYTYEKIANLSGVKEASNFSINFMPSFQKVIIHQLKVYRNNKPKDHLKTAHFQITQRRKNEGKTYLGFHTISILINDLQVNDEIKISYTIYGTDPALHNHFNIYFFIGSYGFSPSQRYRIIAPEDKKIYFKNFDTDLEPSIQDSSTFPDYKDYIWEVRAPEPFIQEPDTPFWYYILPHVEISDYASWTSVVKTLLPYFKVDNIPNSLKTILETIQKNHSQKSEILIACVNFVQKKIRYENLNELHLTFKPSPLEEIIKNKFGDCKDKTLLLLTMLSFFKIEAYPVLVSNHYGAALKDSLPSLYPFDHIIICAKIKNKTYFLTPSYQDQQGLLDYRAPINQGYALILKENENSLTLLPSDHLSSKEIKEVFDLTKGIEGPVGLYVETKLSGIYAESMRKTLETTSIKALTNKASDFYAHSFGPLKSLKDISFKDNIEKNIITLIEQYEIYTTSSFPSTEELLVFYTYFLRTHSTYPELIGDRHHPFLIYYPLRMTCSLEIIIPHYFPTNQYLEEHEKIDDEAFCSENSFTIKENRYVLKIKYEALKDHVFPDRLEEFNFHMKKVRSQVGILKSNITLNLLKTKESSPSFLTNLIRYLYNFFSQ